MAIIIPSKYIYDIDDNKVIDNEVDNLEVGAVNAQETQDYNVVVFNNNYPASQEKETNVENNNLAYLIGEYDKSAIGSFCYVEYNNHKYINVRVLIERTANNQKIESLSLGDNARGNHNIKTTITGRTRKGTVTSSGWEADISYDGNKYNITSLTKHPFVYSNAEWGDPQVYEIVSPLSHSRYFDIVIGQFTVEAREEAIVGNLSTATATEKTLNGKEYYELNLRILTSVRTVEFDSYNTTVNNPTKITIPVSTDVALGSTSYTEYQAENIEINIYGNVIKLDIQDETLKIGNGQHIYSFQGNELMQTTNTDSVNNIYQKVIDNWKEGKEVATLKCAIADYGNAKITIVNSVVASGGYSCLFYSNYIFKPNDKIYYEEDIYIVQSWNEELKSGYLFIPFEHSSDIPYNTEIIVGVNTNKSLFTWGDIVEPYVYGVHGKDKPMATYKDGTPKQFKVTGVHIISDGGIYQDIDIQEIKQ